MRSFIDTNVLLYADSGDEPIKQPQALALLQRELAQGTGVVSTQVLHEFANIALRKFGVPLSVVHERVRLYARFEVVQASVASLQDALDLTARHKLAFWDALIVQAARQSGCAQLLTEDMASGAVIAGVRIVNPFAEPPAAPSAGRKRAATRSPAPKRR